VCVREIRNCNDTIIIIYYVAQIIVPLLPGITCYCEVKAQCVWGGRELSIITDDDDDDDDDDSETDPKYDFYFYLLFTPDRDRFHSSFCLDVETIIY